MGYSNPTLGRIAEIFKDGGMDNDSKKEELKTLLSGKCTDKNKKMEDFVKETFEDFVSDLLDQDAEMKQNLNISGSLADVSKKTKIVMQLWDLNNNDGINDERFLDMKQIMNDVASEL